MARGSAAVRPGTVAPRSPAATARTGGGRRTISAAS